MSIFLGEEFKKRIKAQDFLFRIVLFIIAALISYSICFIHLQQSSANNALNTKLVVPRTHEHVKTRTKDR